MKKNRLFSLLLFLLVANSMFAQLGKAVREILTGDSAVTHTTVRNDSDSIRMANMKRELEEARLNEANMRMEMEQLRLKAFAADSVKLAQQKARIDSLRQFTPGVPVVVEGDTLFYLYTKRGGYTPLQRAEMIDAALYEDLVAQYDIKRVPMMILNDSRIVMGSKTIDEIVTLLK